MRWIRLHSEAGEPCVVRHCFDGPIDVSDGEGMPLPYHEDSPGTVRIGLRKGGTALITARGDRPGRTVRPVAPNLPAPRWGLPPSPCPARPLPLIHPA